MDKQTRQIIAFHVGDRSHESAKQLWDNLPVVYREQAMFYTLPGSNGEIIGSKLDFIHFGYEALSINTLGSDPVPEDFECWVK